MIPKNGSNSWIHFSTRYNEMYLRLCVTSVGRGDVTGRGSHRWRMGSILPMLCWQYPIHSDWTKVSSVVGASQALAPVHNSPPQGTSSLTVGRTGRRASPPPNPGDPASPSVKSHKSHRGTMEEGYFLVCFAGFAADSGPCYHSWSLVISHVTLWFPLAQMSFVVSWSSLRR